MSRREDLLNIGKCFEDLAQLKVMAGKDVVTDMAILCYALQTNKVHLLNGILDVDELCYDIEHTRQHFEILKNRSDKRSELGC